WAVEALLSPGGGARARGRGGGATPAAARARPGRRGLLGGRPAAGRPLRAAQGYDASPCGRRRGGHGGQAAKAEAACPQGALPALGAATEVAQRLGAIARQAGHRTRISDYLGKTPS